MITLKYFTSLVGLSGLTTEHIAKEMGVDEQTVIETLDGYKALSVNFCNKFAKVFKIKQPFIDRMMVMDKIKKRDITKNVAMFYRTCDICMVVDELHEDELGFGGLCEDCYLKTPEQNQKDIDNDYTPPKYGEDD